MDHTELSVLCCQLGHVSSRLELLPMAMSGSVVLIQLWYSVLMSVPSVSLRVM